jgi:hypothetical protein
MLGVTSMSPSKADFSRPDRIVTITHTMQPRRPLNFSWRAKEIVRATPVQSSGIDMISVCCLVGLCLIGSFGFLYALATS